MAHQRSNNKKYLFDSGFTVAKKIWTHLYGEPYKVIKDYWGQGVDHFIWYFD
jgi:hypothetical protein